MYIVINIDIQLKIENEVDIAIDIHQRGEREWLLGVWEREREWLIPFPKFGKGKVMKKTFPKFGNGNGGITVDFWIIKVPTSKSWGSSNSLGSWNSWGSSNSWGSLNSWHP